ncbi:MAG: EF-P lysine aminoacylase GenX [SAR324 cluster bacterium]|nr:EF-P lysine aminoacylase GenX [SAR324 cluster bacterium]
MLHSRQTPYRTHRKPLLSIEKLDAGQYAGRFSGYVEGEKTFAWVLLEEVAFKLCFQQYPQIPEGAIIRFDVDHSCHVLDVEILNCPVTSVPASGDVLRWRQGTVPRMKILRERHSILRDVRNWFDQQDFMEVQTPCLVQAPSPEAQFFPFRVEEDNYLITSPEFQMKRLLVGGFERIYQITTCFRGKENGSRHNPEFTMLEWYRAFDTLGRIYQDLLECLVCVTENHLARTGGSDSIFLKPWQYASVAEVFQEYLHLPAEALLSKHALKLHALEQKHGACLENAESYEEIFFRLWHLMEPKLGHSSPIVVYDWPVQLASLARTREDHPEFVERAELYVSGMELSNGFGELIDASVQRQRFEQNLVDYAEIHRRLPPLDECFLSSLEQAMPPSAGIALGLDRVVMLLTGTTSIQDVLCFAWNER